MRRQYRIFIILAVRSRGGSELCLVPKKKGNYLSAYIISRSLGTTENSRRVICVRAEIYRPIQGQMRVKVKVDVLMPFSTLCK